MSIWGTSASHREHDPGVHTICKVQCTLLFITIREKMRLIFGWRFWVLGVVSLVPLLVDAREQTALLHANDTTPILSLAGTGDLLCQVRTLDVNFVAFEESSVSSLVNDTQDDNNGERVTVCQTFLNNVPQSYRVVVPEDVILSHGDKVWVRNVRLDMENARLVTTDETLWEIAYRNDENMRRLSSVTRNRLMLVIRVTYKGVQPSLSASQLQGRFFGRGSDRVRWSLRTQLEQCSQGQYNIRIPPLHPRIQGGILNLSLNQPISGPHSVLALENHAMATATSVLKNALMDQLDHVAIVFPEHNLIRFSNNPNYLAYGYVGGTITVYRNEWAGRLSALVHELGHNLDLSHSGKSGQEYGDTSGFMGYGVNQVNGPRMCYNGQKHYATGWYATRTRHLFVDDLPFSGYLAFFGDFDKTDPNEPVIISLFMPGGPTTRRRVFLQYNLAKGMNVGTRSSQNAVTMIRDDGSLGETRGLQSWWMGAIAKGVTGVGKSKRYHHAGLGDFVFEICDTIGGDPSKVQVSIHLDNGIQRGTCGKTILPYCDDDSDASFKVNEQLGRRDCYWLARHINVDWVRTTVCDDPNHDGYRLCPETCGACVDECNDRDNAKFWVSNKVGWKPCAWLATKKHWKERLCVPGHDAFRLCPETCDRCD